MGRWKVAYHGQTEDYLRSIVGTEAPGCIEWPFGRNNKNYGLATIDGKQRGAHNWICRLAHGEPIAPKRHAAHICGNPPCVNPNHIRWATHRENMLDKKEHGTENLGERNGKTHLTEADVLYIRNAPACLAPLCEKFGMTRHSISRIRSHKRWAHVADGPKSFKKPRNYDPCCGKGHSWTEENTYWTKTGHRNCRTCGSDNTYKKRTGIARLTPPNHPRWSVES